MIEATRSAVDAVHAGYADATLSAVDATRNSLQSAIDDLGAVCVRPGITETAIGGDGKGPDRTRLIREALYAFQPNQEDWRVWRVTDCVGLSLIGNGCDPRCIGVLMPSWWSPSQRFALKCRCGQIDVIPAGIACSGCDLESQSKRITASLETGEEIAA